MKFIKNYKYWIVNFFGWILFALLMLTIDKISYGGNLPISTIYYFLAEGVLCGFLGFVLSFIILYFVENYFDVGNYTKKDLFKLIIVIIITQIIYHILLWPMLSIPLLYFKGNSFSELTLVMKLTNIPHFLAYFIVWLFVILTLKLVYYINNIKVNQLQLESSLKESQLNTLRGQINPHFMFNSLNNIRGLMLEDVTKARKMLTNLAETLRYSLTKNEVNSIALEDELDMVESYVELAKIQFDDRLQFKKHIVQESLDVQIPPMIIQMLIENAIKHGISNLKDGGEIVLSTLINEDKLEIKVINTGHLKTSNHSTKLGLKNITNRLELLYAGKAKFDLFEKDNNVEANIEIPLI